jgi:peptide chain release factor subunit 1
LPIPNLKGIIIGGPGPTKQEFEKGDYLQYTLKDKIIATLDTAYVDQQGVKEVVERSPDILRRVRYIEERRIMQEFLYEIGHDTGLATYGEDEVRRSLQAGAVKTLLLSEGLDVVRATVKCSVCDYIRQEVTKSRNISNLEQDIGGKPCPKCNNPTLQIVEVKDIIDDLAELAEQAGSDVEVISTETEEGIMLKNSFGGVAAALRFKPPS